MTGLILNIFKFNFSVNLCAKPNQNAFETKGVGKIIEVGVVELLERIVQQLIGLLYVQMLEISLCLVQTDQDFCHQLILRVILLIYVINLFFYYTVLFMIVVINLSWTCLTTVNEISRYLTIALAVELKVKAKNKHHAAIYNHTLATILVQYASAVSSEYSLTL